MTLKRNFQEDKIYNFVVLNIILNTNLNKERNRKNRKNKKTFIYNDCDGSCIHNCANSIFL